MSIRIFLIHQKNKLSWRNKQSPYIETALLVLGQLITIVTSGFFCSKSGNDNKIRTLGANEIITRVFYW